jgi:glycosyltransferase involved in cell wall biosynthesis
MRKPDLKTIMFVSKEETAPSTRYRALAYFDRLRSDGWDPVHLPAPRSLFARLQILRAARTATIVVLLRKTFGRGYIRLLRKCSRHLILDFDDAVFCRSNGRSSQTRRSRFERTVSLCDGIWAGNRFLGEAARAHQANVFVLPTALEPAKYNGNSVKPDDKLVIVWIGSHSTRKYLEAELPTLEKVAERVGRLELKIVADFTLDSDRLTISAVPWSEETEANALRSAHIGIAPMPDNDWTRGKCGLKVLQYLAAGLPVVSAPTGVNAEIIENGKTGFLPRNGEEWCQAVRTLSENPDLRERMGAAGRRKVCRMYSVEAVYQEMKRSLDEILQAGRNG